MHRDLTSLDACSEDLSTDGMHDDVDDLFMHFIQSLVDQESAGGQGVIADPAEPLAPDDSPAPQAAALICLPPATERLAGVHPLGRSCHVNTCANNPQ